MQTAPRDASDRSTKDVSVAPRVAVRKRRGVSPTVIAIAAILTVLSLGTMFAVIGGFWPPRSAAPSVPPTPISQSATGLEVEVIGEPRREGDQVFATVRVTNNVKVPDIVRGTVTAEGPTPEPVPANLNNGSVKVFFYDLPSNDPARVLVGSAIGNVVDLKFGESKEIEVVGTGIGQFCTGCFEAFPDTVWTDRDVIESTPAP